MPERPNIVLLVFDTARADAFEPYGAAAGSTPAFADVARAGAVAERFHSTACWTVPAHASIFTGLLPRDAGLIRAPGGAPRGCAPVLAAQRERLLPVVLGEAGYETVGVSTNLWISGKSGFDLGFDHFHTVDGGRQGTLAATSRRAQARWLYEAARARADDGAAEAGLLLDRHLDEAGEQPFFWFVNLVEAHSPYLPPRPYNPLGPLGRLRSAQEARRHLTMSEIWRACAGGFDVPSEAIERMRALYAASVRQLDDWLAGLLQRLDDARQLEETLLLVTSDHGENIGEDGRMGHAFSLDQRLLHLPLAARGPNLPAISAAGPLSLLELPRMIAEAAGVRDHPYGRAGAEPPAGIAVAQFDPPAGPDHPRISEALTAWGLGEEAIPRFTSRLTIATDGRYKLLRRERDELLFDLETDPAEADPIAAGEGEPTAVAALREAISQALEPALADPQITAEAPAELTEAEREKLEERMRLLGYM